MFKVPPFDQSLTRFLIICHILEHISSNVLCVSYGLMVLKFIREYLSQGSNIKRVKSGKKVQMCTSMQKKIFFVLFGQLLLFDRISKNITRVTSLSFMYFFSDFWPFVSSQLQLFNNYSISSWPEAFNGKTWSQKFTVCS